MDSKDEKEKGILEEGSRSSISTDHPAWGVTGCLCCSAPNQQLSRALLWVTASSPGEETHFSAVQSCFGTQQPCLHQQAPAQSTTKPTAAQRAEMLF